MRPFADDSAYYGHWPSFCSHVATVAKDLPGPAPVSRGATCLFDAISAEPPQWTPAAPRWNEGENVQENVQESILKSWIFLFSFQPFNPYWVRILRDIHGGQT